MKLCTICGVNPARIQSGKLKSWCRSCKYQKKIASRDQSNRSGPNACSRCYRSKPNDGFTRCDLCALDDDHRRQKKIGVYPVFSTKYIAIRDDFNCHLCRTKVRPKDCSSDHIIPHSYGGGYEESNLRLAHKRCNSSRGNQLLENLDIEKAHAMALLIMDKEGFTKGIAIPRKLT